MTNLDVDTDFTQFTNSTVDNSTQGTPESNQSTSGEKADMFMIIFIVAFICLSTILIVIVVYK